MNLLLNVDEAAEKKEEPQAKETATDDANGAAAKTEKTLQEENAFKNAVQRLDFAGSFGYSAHYYSFNNKALGGSFLATFPALDEGFIPRVNDSFLLEAGIFANWSWFGYSTISHLFSLMPAVGGRWVFHLDPKWDVFAAARFGILFDRPTNFEPSGVGGVGVLWHFQENLAFRAEVNNMNFWSLGVSIPY